MTGELELLIDGVDFGEGPRWHNGEFWYSDFYQQRVFRIDSQGVRRMVVELVDDQPSGLGWMPNGDLLVVAMLSRKVLRYDGQNLSEHADLSGLATGHCNDMVVDDRGNAYVGNFGFDLEAGAAFQPANLILVHANGDAAIAASDLAFPNGTVITPDGATLIVGQSFGGSYVAFDVASNGELSNRRDWATIPGSAPDGCALDADGAIWFSDATGSQLIRVIEGGEVTHRIPTPQPTFACTLGGADGKTLFVLTAPSAAPKQVAGQANGAIYTLRVDTPGAGRP